MGVVCVFMFVHAVPCYSSRVFEFMVLWLKDFLLPKSTDKLVEVGEGDTEIEICFWWSNIIHD